MGTVLKEDPDDGGWRPYALPDGKTELTRLDRCRCWGRRGPAGGVCGNCCGAIPRTVLVRL